MKRQARFRLSPRAMKKQDEKSRIEIEAFSVLHQIVAEFESDPMSVQCFDLNLVNRAIYISKLLKEYNESVGGFI